MLPPPLMGHVGTMKRSRGLLRMSRSKKEKENAAREIVALFQNAHAH